MKEIFKVGQNIKTIKHKLDYSAIVRKIAGGTIWIEIIKGGDYQIDDTGYCPFSITTLSRFWEVDNLFEVKKRYKHLRGLYENKV